MWNGVPEPARVTSLAARNPGVVAGSNTSVVSRLHPVNSAAISQPMPPMWVNGKMRADTSSDRMSRHSAMARAEAITVRSVCGAPLGSAVVPEV